LLMPKKSSQKESSFKSLLSSKKMVSTIFLMEARVMRRPRIAYEGAFDQSIFLKKVLKISGLKNFERNFSIL
jgi:hypothetical protein